MLSSTSRTFYEDVAITTPCLNAQVLLNFFPSNTASLNHHDTLRPPPFSVLSAVVFFAFLKSLTFLSFRLGSQIPYFR